jgi:hypothetical protein
MTAETVPGAAFVLTDALVALTIGCTSKSLGLLHSPYWSGLAKTQTNKEIL